MTYFTYDRRNIPAGSATLTAIQSMIQDAGKILRWWAHNYRSRRELAMLSDRERRDLNFSGAVDSEIAKPFWKK